MCRVDVARRFRIIVESFADLANGDFQDRFADEGPRPHGFEKFLFRDELTGTPEQIIEHCKWLGAKLDHV